jgi:hypothetical protein
VGFFSALAHATSPINFDAIRFGGAIAFSHVLSGCESPQSLRQPPLKQLCAGGAAGWRAAGHIGDLPDVLPAVIFPFW